MWKGNTFKRNRPIACERNSCDSLSLLPFLLCTSIALPLLRLWCVRTAQHEQFILCLVLLCLCPATTYATPQTSGIRNEEVGQPFYVDRNVLQDSRPTRVNVGKKYHHNHDMVGDRRRAMDAGSHVNHAHLRRRGVKIVITRRGTTPRRHLAMR